MSASSPRRRFLPEPVKTTTKSSRRFAVEPVETTTRSSKAKDEVKKPEGSSETDVKPRRRFIPEPIETSKARRMQAVKPAPELTPELSPQSPPLRSEETAPKPRRRFAPQLIETTRRSKKAGDARPATLPTDKTDITPGTNHIYLPRRRFKERPSPVPIAPDNTPASSSVQIQQINPLPPHRQGSMRPHPNTRRSTRQNSFQPELEPIMSAESSDEMDEEDKATEEGTPSLVGSYGSSEESILRSQLARTRESCDDRFSGYLLSLAAKAAEKQLREQALAAFPNSDYHDPVEHFYDREVEPGSDDEEVVGVGLLPHEMLGLRRQSTEVGWAAREMQQHQETLSRLREEETNQKIADEATNPTWADPFWTNGMTKKGAVVELQKEMEIDKMRTAASPPMLGGDLQFRRCPSPKATKFETDQPAEIKLHRREDGGGLWGGYCVAEEDSQYLSPVVRRPSMLQTPTNEIDDPFASAFGHETSGKKSRPTSSSAKGVHMLTGLDERLKTEVVRIKMVDGIQEEFDDKFVTQVYNYLSLGYPSLARQYDEELSKITNIPIQELSKDDDKESARGHVGLAGKQVNGSDTRCPRWTALRLYILEWARQHPSMGNDAASPNAWGHGVRARRGSWAI